MKNKKIFLVIIIVLLSLLFSCNKKVVEENKIELSSNTDNKVFNIQVEYDSIPEEIVIYFLDNLIRTYNGKYDYTNWSEHIKDEYNINIQVEYCESFENLNNGIVEIGFYNISSISKYIESGSIKRLNDILSKSEAFMALPENLKNSFTDNQGNIWGIPNTYAIFPMGRFYNREVLESIKMSVPTTLDEMYDLFLTIKDKTDYTGMIYNDSHKSIFIQSFQDVFNANGCYFPINNTSSITYDEQSDTYEDFLNKPEAVSTLEYIRSLINTNLAIITEERYNSSNIIKVLDDSKSASVYYDGYAYSIFDNYDYSLGVMGLKEENYADMDAYATCYVVPSSTNISDETITNLINFMYGSKEGRISMKYGINDLNYRINDNTITRFENTNENQIVEWFKPIIDLPINSDIQYISTVIDGETVYSGDNISIFESFKINHFIDESLVRLIKPLYPQFPSNDKVKYINGASYIYYYFKDDSGISIKEFITNYKYDIRKAGYDKLLYDANEKLGKDTVYYY